MAQGEPPIQYIHMAGIVLHVTPFNPPENRLNTGPAWETWLEEFEEEMQLQKVQEADKVTCLRRYGGKEIRNKIKYLPDPPVIEDEESAYQKEVRKLNLHYKPKQNKMHSVYVFNKTTRIPGETIASFTARLREKAEHCDFGENADARILERIIQTMDDKQIVTKAIQRNWNLETLIQEVSQKEDLNKEVDNMRNEFKVAKISDGVSVKPKRRYPQLMKKPINPSSRLQCSRCGGQIHNRDKCPASGKQCFKCSKWNHFQKVCKTQKPSDKPTAYRGRKMVKKTELEDSSESDNGDFIKTVHVHRIKQEHVGETIEVRINDITCECEPDSGAATNVMDEHQFKHLSRRSDTTLKPSKEKLKTIQSELIVLGECPVTIQNSISKFIVIKGHLGCKPLIGRKTLEDLGMMEIREDGSLKEENDLKIKVVKEDKTDVQKILDEYKDVFTGIGHAKDPKSGAPIEVKLEMETDVNPVAQKPRHVAFHLLDPLKEFLEQGEEEGIYEKVPEGEAITWCSPLVVQPKPKYTSVRGKLEPHMIRASIDMRIPNQGMKRSRCVQAPIIEDFTYHLRDCSIYSKLDLRSGYHQLSIDEECCIQCMWLPIGRVLTMATTW
ncbi:uncharacterized protein LOC106173287 [Lingula anatina]|uniref:Uncharacterized protein LOC106173287 n=1 Tax=Lingula anatina TaxID=7574 RepID=A0A1S3JI51_LINAN|nr:uncharacterized protein LOC106173287 [Lingula anatina]|eukprot:XP_013409816.1 uncharacterized protein LOC106173287 [Lingula anatina]